MPESNTRRRFARAPVVETRLMVQFAPLQGLRAGHFGLFWSECLGLNDWQAAPDAELQPHAQESFDAVFLEEFGDPGPVDATPVRMALRTSDGKRRVQLQADQLAFAFSRGPTDCPEYETVRTEFVGLVANLETFVRRRGLPDLAPNLWSITYVNAIPAGQLWATVGDWHDVFPTLFPEGVPGGGVCNWASFNGEWHLDLPDRRGRVHIRASKSASRADNSVVLLVTITVRGAVDERNPDWIAGVQLGHTSAVGVFRELASPRAKQYWGEQP